MQKHRLTKCTQRAACLTLLAAALAGCGGNNSLPGTLSDLISLAGFAMKGTLI